MKNMPFCCLLVAIAATLVAGDKPVPCTARQAIQAEKDASSQQDWRHVYKSYKRFAHCDDAAIAEGDSDSVARLLSDKWDRTYELNRLASRDIDFQNFILRHIDELMSPTQAKKILDNAEAHCPANAERLCRAIAARTREISARESR